MGGGGLGGGGGGGGQLGIFWVGMCRLGLQIGPRSKRNFP